MERIEHKLDRILRGEQVLFEGEILLMADQAALDEAVASLSSAVDAIVAKLGEAPVQMDFTAEIASLQESTQNITDALATPDPVPTPDPTPEPTPEGGVDPGTGQPVA